MNSTVITVVISTVVIATTLGCFVVWVRGTASIPGRRSIVRAIVALVVVTIVLATSLTLFGRFMGVGSPLFAATATMVTLGWTAFANDVFAMRLPVGLRPIRSWEVRPFPYRTLGVAAFGRFLRTTPVRHLNPAVYFRGSGTPLPYVRAHLETAETVHFWGAAFTVPYFVFCCAQGWWPAVVAILLIHVPVNLYPICHLRLARSRLASYLSR